MRTPIEKYEQAGREAAELLARGKEVESLTKELWFDGKVEREATDDALEAARAYQEGFASVVQPIVIKRNLAPKKKSTPKKAAKKHVDKQPQA